MSINTSPDRIVRSTGQVTPGYMSGFKNSFETEALPGEFVEVTITDATEYDLVGTAAKSHHGGTETRRKKLISH